MELSVKVYKVRFLLVARQETGKNRTQGNHSLNEVKNLFHFLPFCKIKSTCESFTNKITTSGTRNDLLVKSYCTSSEEKCINRTMAILIVYLNIDPGSKW